jgi:hypothetical protein
MTRAKRNGRHNRIQEKTKADGLCSLLLGSGLVVDEQAAARLIAVEELASINALNHGLGAQDPGSQTQAQPSGRGR